MDVKEIIITGKFTDAQLDILKIFSHDVPDETWKEIKHLIAGYFAQKATGEMDGCLKKRTGSKRKLMSGLRNTCEDSIKNESAA